MKNDLFPLFVIKVTFSGLSCEKIAELALSENIPIFSLSHSDGKTSFFVRQRFFKRITSRLLFLYPGAKFTFERKRLLGFLYRYRRRYGMIAGIFVFSFMLIFFSGFIWSVEIEGNNSVPEAEIREALRKAGVFEGAHINRADKDRARLSIEANDTRISGISVNFIGTKAKVEVRESTLPPTKSDEKIKYSNLVAKISGKIKSIEATSGETDCKVGDHIRKGEILIGGIVELKNGAYKLCRSAGKVFAETERVFECEIPLSEEKVIFTGNEKEFREYSFLGKRIGLSCERKPNFETYETGIIEEDLTVFGVKLPIRVKRRILSESVRVETPINIDRARDLAYDEYKNFIRDNLGTDYEILSEKSEFTETENSLKATFCFTATEDIAEEKEFYYVP